MSIISFPSQPLSELRSTKSARRRVLILCCELVHGSSWRRRQVIQSPQLHGLATFDLIDHLLLKSSILWRQEHFCGRPEIKAGMPVLVLVAFVMEFCRGLFPNFLEFATCGGRECGGQFYGLKG